MLVDYCFELFDIGIGIEQMGGQSSCQLVGIVDLVEFIVVIFGKNLCKVEVREIGIENWDFVLVFVGNIDVVELWFQCLNVSGIELVVFVFENDCGVE